MNRGKLVILVMLSLALSLSVLAVWQRYRQQRQTHAWWGKGAARLIATAPKIELFQLTSADNSTLLNLARGLPKHLNLVDGKYPGIVARDISADETVVQLRTTLLQDASYQWPADKLNCEPQGEYAIQFSDPAEQLTILISLQCPAIMLVGSPDAPPSFGTWLGTGPVAPGMRTFVERHFRATGK